MEKRELQGVQQWSDGAYFRQVQYLDNRGNVIRTECEPYVALEHIVHHGIAEGRRLEMSEDYFETVNPQPRHEPVESRMPLPTHEDELRRCASKLRARGLDATARWVEERI